MYIKYNDYELLYLIEEGSEEAYEALFEKYYYLINQKIVDFRIKEKYQDDFFQEGLIVLNNAIKSYDEYKGKTFTKYFEMLLNYRFQRLLVLERDYFYRVTLIGYPEMFEDYDIDNTVIEEVPSCYEEERKKMIEKLNLSDLETEIIFLLAQGHKPRDIVKMKNIEARSVYNALSRAKRKAIIIKK